MYFFHLNVVIGLANRTDILDGYRLSEVTRIVLRPTQVICVNDLSMSAPGLAFATRQNETRHLLSDSILGRCVTGISCWANLFRLGYPLDRQPAAKQRKHHIPSCQPAT